MKIQLDITQRDSIGLSTTIEKYVNYQAMIYKIEGIIKDVILGRHSNKFDDLRISWRYLHDRAEYSFKSIFFERNEDTKTTLATVMRSALGEAKLTYEYHDNDFINCVL